MLTNVLETKKARQIGQIISKAHVKNPLWSYAWYFMGLPLILLASAFITWGSLEIRPEALPMTLLVIGLYIGVWANRHQSTEYRSHRAIGLSAFYATIGFVVVFSLLAMFRFYYARSFLLSAYGLTVLWNSTGMLFFRRRHHNYIIIRGGLADKLLQWTKEGWEYVRELRKSDDVSHYDGIVIDLHDHEDTRLLKTVADLSLQGVPVVHAASVFEKYSGRTHLDYLAHEGLYSLAPSNPYRFFKPIWEVGLILVAVPIILPLMALTAIAIKLDSKGSVLFTQERVGKDGKLFTLYKFRSMYTGAEDDGSQFADEKDDRVTRVGRFIRKFRIDELPQFWNVISGDMSLIGPRPEQKDFVEFFDEEIPFYSYRHKVRPGITGWAQINNGYTASLEGTKEKLEYDLYYVKNLSFSLDLLTIYETTKTILTGFGSR